jgi:D-glycero-alpha-D-manno-heptose-7-phosphate kinase
LQHQQAALAGERKKQNVTRKMVELAGDLRRELQGNRVDAFGSIIHEGWLLKKSLTKGISTDLIDDWYARARRAGAVGGKLLGAGTGGFLMFYAGPERHDEIARALGELRRMTFRFEPAGSRIIFVHH